MKVYPLSTSAHPPSMRAMADPQHKTQEHLPFTVRLVRDETDLDKAVQIRHQAYARHMPELAEHLKSPETVDLQAGVVLLLAESKLDGSALGSLRIHTNRYVPLPIEKSVTLPPELRAWPLAQVSRLGIAQGLVGRLVKLALIKASFMYCEKNDIKWAVLAARSPLDRQYAQLDFTDLYPDTGYIALPHMNHVPHRVMGFEIDTGESRWRKAQHPLLSFFCHTHHPDLDVSASSDTPPAPVCVAYRTDKRAPLLCS